MGFGNADSLDWRSFYSSIHGVFPMQVDSACARVVEAHHSLLSWHEQLFYALRFVLVELLRCSKTKFALCLNSDKCTFLSDGVLAPLCPLASRELLGGPPGACSLESGFSAQLQGGGTAKLRRKRLAPREFVTHAHAVAFYLHDMWPLWNQFCLPSWIALEWALAAAHLFGVDVLTPRLLAAALLAPSSFDLLWADVNNGRWAEM